MTRKKRRKPKAEPELGCTCTIEDRSWDNATGVCATCGNRFRDLKTGQRNVTKPKTHNALEVLGKVSGLGTDEAKRIFDDVKANLALLDSCPRHIFEANEKQGELVRNYKCKRCGGVLDSINVRWYNKGLVHGVQHDPA